MWVDSNNLDFQEKLLWFNVLRRAVFDFVLYKGSGKNKLKWQRAYQYLFDDNKQPEGGPTFREVCTLFGWEPDYIRKLSKELHREDLKKIETSRFREDFQEGYQARPPKRIVRALQEVLPESQESPPTVEQKAEFLFLVLRWEIGAPVPMLHPADLSDERRVLLRLRTVRLENRHVSILNKGAWEASTA